jgi:Flp pilus assembly protein TadG
MTHPRSRRRDRGSSAVELVILTPVLILIVFGIVQAALLWHAQHIADAAAQQGDRLARADTGHQVDPATIRTDTLAYLHQLGADLVTTPTVTVTSTPTWATVTVTGHAVSLIPGRGLTIHATSRGPVERFTP